jgi:uncharacterized membrane protein required for colicin V production
MPNIVDYILTFLLIFYFLTGWERGFWRTVFAPLSLVIGSVIGYLFFLWSHNLFVSLIISIVSPFLFNILFNLFLKAINPDPPFFTFGRLLGAFFSVIWGGTIVSLILMLIVFAPFKNPTLEKLQYKIHSSLYYRVFEAFTNQKTQSVQTKITNIQEVMQDPEKLSQLEETEAYQDLMNDEKLRDIFSDESFLEQIKEHRYVELLSSPKLKAVLEDKELIHKIFALNKEIMQMKKKEKTAEE